MKKLILLLVLILIAAALFSVSLAAPEPFGDLDAPVADAGIQPVGEKWNLPNSESGINRRVVVTGQLSGGVEYELFSDGLLHLHGADVMNQLKSEANLRTNFSSIKSISFGNDVENIGRYAISDIPTLEAVYFSDSVKAVGDYAFSDCVNLTEISGLEKMRSIGMYAFSGCTAIKSVTLSEVESIGQYAFYNCSQMQTLMIGDQLKEMQVHAFDGCSSLNSVTIASSVPDQAFSGVASIQSVFIQAPASHVGREAFARLSALNFLKMDASVYVIETGAFEKCASLTSLILPENMDSIGDYAFSECTSLRILSMPENLSKIGGQAFFGCSLLADVDIQAMQVGNRAFAGCSGLKNVSFSNPSSIIGTDVLSGCALDEIVISCENIPARAFRNLDVMKISLTDRVRNIGESAFENSAVRNLVLSSGVQRIDSYAFRACQNLESILDETGRQISVPASVTSMGKWIFYECKSLQKLTIACPQIAEEAFRGMTGLETFTVTDTVRKIGRKAFMDCTSLIQVDLGENSGVEIIEDEAFNGCTSVSRVRLPVSLKSVGSNVFLNCDGAIQLIVYCGTGADWYKVNVDKDIKKWTGVRSNIPWHLKGSNEYKNWK